MKFLYSLGGGNIPVIREFDIDAKTNVAKGQAVMISPYGVVSTDITGSCIGIAAEDHTGEKDLLNERNNGTKLRIDITKDAVYSVNAPKLVATGGSATTFVCSANGITTNLAGANLVLVQKGENSENTDSVGSVRKVVSVTVSGTSATFTFDTGSVISAGDIYALVPKYGFKGFVADDGKSFSCATGNNVTELYVVNYNIEALTLEVMLNKNFIA